MINHGHGIAQDSARRVRIDNTDTYTPGDGLSSREAVFAPSARVALPWDRLS